MVHRQEDPRAAVVAEHLCGVREPSDEGDAVDLTQ